MTWLRRLFERTPRILSSVEAYTRWAATYPAQAHNALMQAEETAMRSLLPEITDATVVDVACGSGRWGRIAYEQGAARVIGVDNSVAMLRQARLPVAAGDVTRLPVRSAMADVVLCGLALGHLPQIDIALAEIGRVLRPSGVALISDFHPYQALNGAQRTFHSAGQTFAVEHYVHLAADYLQAGQAANLELTGLAEPTLHGDAPVVLVLRFQKQS